MATRGNSNQIIIGAAQLFVATNGALEYIPGSDPAEYSFNSSSVSGIPTFVSGTGYADTLEADVANWRNLGYTTNGLEVQFQPDFGEVQVDQLLDVAKLFKQGMQVNMATSMAEATLENLVVAIATADSNKTGTTGIDNLVELNVTSGDLGEVPVERALVAVGPGSGDPSAVGPDKVERVYVAHRALSIDNVTVSAKRNEASMFDVSFRLLPAANGSYGKIVDRVVGA